jgi:hypothetical protein
MIAMQVGTNVRVMHQDLSDLVTVANLGNLGSGLVFDPNRDVLYAANSTDVIAYDAHTWAEEYRFDIGETVPPGRPFDNGEMTVSDDGAWLFFATPTGVRVYPLAGSGAAADRSAGSQGRLATIPSPEVASLPVALVGVSLSFERQRTTIALPSASSEAALDMLSPVALAIDAWTSSNDTAVRTPTRSHPAGLTQDIDFDLWAGLMINSL